jgi:Fic family protein
MPSLSFERFLLLEHWNLLSAPLLYLSLYFKRHRAEYYQLLGEVRKSGDWETWIGFFLEGISTIADEAVAGAREVFLLVHEDRKRLLAAPGTSVMAIRLMDRLPTHPVVTSPAVVKLLKTTKPTAGKAVQVWRNWECLPRLQANSETEPLRMLGTLSSCVRELNSTIDSEPP